MRQYPGHRPIPQPRAGLVPLPRRNPGARHAASVLGTKPGLDLEHARAAAKALEAMTIDAGAGPSRRVRSRLPEGCLRCCGARQRSYTESTPKCLDALPSLIAEHWQRLRSARPPSKREQEVFEQLPAGVRLSGDSEASARAMWPES
jgi:hypothetical protein